MLQVALSQLKTHSRRFIAITLAVLLAVAFLSATLMVNASTEASLKASIGQAYSTADLVISPPGNEPLTTANADSAASSPLVSASYAQRMVYVDSSLGSATVASFIRSVPNDPALESVPLNSGAWPSREGEIVVDSVTAERNSLSVGSKVTLTGQPAPPAEGQEGTPVEPEVAATVTGISATSKDPQMSGMAQFVGTTADVEALGAASPGYGAILVKVAPGVSISDAKNGLSTALSLPVDSVQTPDEKTTEMVAGFTGGQDQLTIVLLAFAGVALLVSALVVSNTFSVLVAQRTRELALLRCIGASRRQVRNSVMLEALLVGFTASVLGVLFAVGTMALVLTLLSQNPDFSFATLAVPPSAVIAGLVVGTLLTVLAALVPARAATAVAPLAALRPADDISVHNSGGRLRLGIGILLLLAGGAGLVYGGISANLLIALPAGAASFVGFLMAATLFVPKLVSLAGSLAAPAGVPGKMAAANAVRNPRRTTATASALLIGVTLVTMMMTGAATARHAFDTELDAIYPVDVTVESFPGDPAITDQAVAAAAALPGVEHIARLELVGMVTAGDTQLPAYGISDSDAAALLANPANRPAGTSVVLPSSLTATTATLAAGTQTTNLTATPGTNNGGTALVSLGSFTPLAAGDPLRTQEAAPLWISVDQSLDTNELMDLRTSLASALGVNEYMVSGAVLEKAMFSQVINMLLLVVTGLLAVAVFIALIGVANTLSLSVLERTRENSLLRALGLTRGQLRGMLALEAVLIAGVAAVIGSVLGTLYGWAGAQSGLGTFTEVTAVVPWGQIGAVVLVAAVAGLLASVVPARRAAKLSPVEGLAMD
ncbi:putative ABC transport system permease protein [Arthrobacter stackebrandtii]|uniref:ABC transport system permease protein n=1 Tax=Arthrobacter stackebrandtii TaxID=272161 RepID=A0ABS4YYV5_9MICC|nr:ABC transporter permease [Arthrobacter stackebrandtii]MBP2413979.1 putative ABC transport system permease protein [Arthrobacter stackebrandtii]PYG98995.1 ABC transporter permease [Arthrobacter stackebrandtii]